MPMPPEHYPAGWTDFSLMIRLFRAGQRCECTGQCGLHQPNPQIRRCIERAGHKAAWARGKVVLTVAHLCDCQPICMNPAHVRAMCQRCHLRVDRYTHAAHRRARADLAKSSALTIEPTAP